MRPAQDILQFSDYRSFLVNYAEEARAKNPRWSYGSWARSLGLKGTSSITKVLNGERDPGPQVSARLIRYFQFSKNEAEHFKKLLLLQQLKNDPRLSSILFGANRDRGKAAVPIHMLSLESYEVISNWYHQAIREMPRLQDFKEDPERISEQIQFGVSPEIVREAIARLLKVGLLSRRSDGHLVISKPRYSTTNDVPSSAIRAHHAQMLDNAKQSLNLHTVHEREFTGSSLAIRTENLSKAKAIIAKFKKEFSELLEDSQEADAVYQIQIQFFPLAKKGAPPS